MNICAISTPAGIGGIAVARISGPQAITIVDKIWKGKTLSVANSHTAHLGTIFDPESPEPLDQAVATIYHAPHSFTGENVVELSVHGSAYIQLELINLLIRTGCRLAEPGEFTRRAFINGQLDLAEAEAVADIIAAESRASNRIAQQQLRGSFSRKLSDLRQSLIDLSALLELELDFSEEDVEFANRSHLLQLATETLQTVEHLASTFSTGNAIRNGVPVAIVGMPNAGKSSILNLLLDDNRAIVSNIPGTTRDTIEDTTQIDGITFRFIDTAGLRKTDDTIENMGIDRTFSAIGRAQIILWVVDVTTLPKNTELVELREQIKHHINDDSVIILVANKMDLTPNCGDKNITNLQSTVPGIKTISLSAKTRQGTDVLKQTLSESIGTISTISTKATDIIVTNARHYQALIRAAASLQRIVSALSSPPTNNISSQLTATQTLQSINNPISGQSIPISQYQYHTNYAENSSEFIAQDLREAIHHLSSITGQISTPDILSTIFSRFCIGK